MDTGEVICMEEMGKIYTGDDTWDGCLGMEKFQQLEVDKRFHMDELLE